MKPSLFYPIAFIAILALLGSALYPGVVQQRDLRDRMEQIEARGFRIDGEGLNGFQKIEGVDFLVSEPGAFTRVRIIALQERILPLDGVGVGAFISIPPPVADLFAGRPIVVTINAKASRAAPSEQYSAAYLAVGSGERDWHHFNPNPSKHTDFEFEYTPPDRRNPDGAYICIWPDTAGGRGSIEILSIRIELAENRIGQGN